jgi:hypothetical protein
LFRGWPSAALRTTQIPGIDANAEQQPRRPALTWRLKAVGFNFGVLFTDVWMPSDMNGIALSHHVKAHRTARAVFFDPGPHRSSRRPGSRTLAKPILAKGLLSSLYDQPCEREDERNADVESACS